jgi:drug/metabolite transporter (DMT)-like permease
MSDAAPQDLRYRTVITWGGIAIIVVGLILAVTGEVLPGLLLAVAGMLIWLFVKRRSRKLGA